MTRIQTPPILSGDQAQQLIAIRRYLFTMSRQLEQALSSLDESNFAPGSAAQKVLSGGVGSGVEESMAAQAAALKALIIKSADIVRAETDLITARLEACYQAVSDYGAFMESVNTQVRANAYDVTALYDYYARLENYAGQTAADLDSYITETGGHIKFGIVDWDADTPVFGVAVGQDIQVEDETVTVDGKEYAQIKKNSFLSLFTARKLSFRQNDTEVAYLSNEKLYITTAHIMSRLELSGKWEISAAGGLTIKWLG